MRIESGSAPHPSFDNDLVARFAGDWIESWNAHDLERILSHYSDHVEMSSPYVALVVGDQGGTIKGIEQLREYWTRALAKRPLLHFDLLQTFSGVNSATLLYKTNLTGKNVVETFNFDAQNKIIRAHAYSQIR